MILKRFYEDYLAQASFLVGCERTRQAIVIDPHRDIGIYMEAAEQAGLKIVAVTETHIHADFVSGARDLARALDVAFCFPSEGGKDWSYAIDKSQKTRPLKHGDRIEVGSVQLEVVHTPGHTPEHIVFLVTDTTVSSAPIGAFTGDFIFVGDVGRPDLLEKAAGLSGTMRVAAAQLYKSLRVFSELPDHLQLWPGHGAGSACGKSLGAMPQTTLGYEKLSSWAFGTGSEIEFIERVLEGQPDPPLYFVEMKRLNRDGAPPPSALSLLPELSDSRLRELADAGELIVDTRTTERFANGFLAGTINIPLNKSFLNWAGSILPYDRDVHLIVDSPEEAQLSDARRALQLIGLDRVAGYASAGALERITASGEQLSTVPQLDVTSLRRTGGMQILDVRTATEWSEGHVPGSLQLALQSLVSKLDQLDPAKPLVVHCAGGARSAIAASLLMARGFSDVHNVIGGFGAWKKAGLPVDKR